ncbi:MAG: hypothetical protein ACRCUZ_16160 [Shewanella sp.]
MDELANGACPFLGEAALKKYKFYRCPQCQQRTAVAVMYGYPSNEVFDAYRAGRVALGGCIILSGVGVEQPNRKCNACGHSWLAGRRKTVKA